MTSGARVGANLATLANAVLGVGAILYILAGNKLWAMLLIGCGVGFDGLDGLLSRRAGGPPSAEGRVLDSVADAITFGIAPAALVVVHTEHSSLWAPWYPYTLLVGFLVAGLALGRLVYFTWRGWQRPHFVGASTPQNALAVIGLLLFLDVPAFVGTNPLGVLVVATFLALLMVFPVPYPKLRRGMPLRWAMLATAAALGVSLVPLQFHPSVGSSFYVVGEIAATVAVIGLAAYYLVGPWVARAESTARASGGMYE
ncbi:MAG: CDP-alcohol phosphatidyltransferase family protein [Thermoplasmata archaeon]|nr:CDP-alcohol phosphatidyltransferase family protein [Thermoplasmata archaeon]